MGSWGEIFHRRCRSTTRYRNCPTGCWTIALGLPPRVRIVVASIESQTQDDNGRTKWQDCCAPESASIETVGREWSISLSTLALGDLRLRGRCLPMPSPQLNGPGFWRWPMSRALPTSLLPASSRRWPTKASISPANRASSACCAPTGRMPTEAAAERHSHPGQRPHTSPRSRPGVVLGYDLPAHPGAGAMVLSVSDHGPLQPDDHRLGNPCQR